MTYYPEFEEEEEIIKPIDYMALFFKYLSYWKWFVLSLAVCLLLAFIYLKTTTPVYEVGSTLLVKDDSKGGGTDELAGLKDMGLLDQKNNVDNELEVLQTTNLTEKAVRDLGLYVSYSEVGFFRNTILYGDESPVHLTLPDAVLDTLSKPIEFEMTVFPNDGYEFNGTYADKDFTVKAATNDSLVILPFGPLHFKRTRFINKKELTLKIGIQNPVLIANGILSRMTMELTSKSTSVVKITLKTNNVKLGKSFLNKLIEVYNQEDMLDQNQVANNTAVFVDERLKSLTTELSQVESQVENYKQSQGLTDIQSEAELFIQKTGDYEQKRLEVETQLAIVSDIYDYINKKENRYHLLPAGTGIQNTSLNGLITDYNTLVLQRNRLSRTASNSNQAMIDLNAQIDGMFSTVLASVRDEKRSLQITRQDLVKKNNENAGRIKAIPRQEREYTEIKRQQGIKEALYLFLLQKKEENFLNMVVVVPKGKIIDKPRSNGMPVSPQKRTILMLAFILGFIIPILTLYIRELLRYQIENKEELEKISDVPLLGEIPKSNQTGNIIIRENSSNRFTEMFRLLRTNLLFVLNDPEQKVINVISSISGEGKTFICINLAMSLALLDKKVLIIGMDVRKPKLGEYIGIDNKPGITLYLSGHLDKKDLARPSGIHPNLSVITAGPVPPNPGELMAKPMLDDLIIELKKTYDYIIVDTAPLGLVSDAFTLNRFADVSLYLVRADYTPKKNIEEATKLYHQKKIKNMYFIINAEDLHKATFRYGYGRKYGYGYGYGYGEHYGTYGEEDDTVGKK